MDDLRAAQQMRELPVDPVAVAAAAEAGLRYVSDDRPGIARLRAGKGFSYRLPGGEPLRDARVLERIRSLAIPPAYGDVWICTDPRGHIQATGRDDRGRKQYRYHPRWREIRDGTKYDRLVAFAEALPAIRARVDDDVGLRGLQRARVLAAIVQLLERTLIRVGNTAYARDNKSFGLTTLRNRHVDVRGADLRFEFMGKSGKKWNIRLQDRRLARLVKSCQELPGQDLFQYVDEAGERHAVGSADVNDYLREISGEELTAKDFRTWAGTVLTAYALKGLGSFTSETAAQRSIRWAIADVAGKLGNTLTICRKCYVHPAVLEAYVDRSLPGFFKRRARRAGLSPAEAAVLALLKRAA
jgi:DNA topoisomerase-1